MPLMEWTEKLSVGVAQYDNEHKKLVGMVNELYDGMQAGHGKEVVGAILDRLIDYTKTHFANEEKAFVTLNYPDYLSHKAEHDALTRQVMEVQKKYKAGASVVLSMEVMSFLKNWLVKHIMGTDKAYRPYLNAKGVK
jgi:hemerythrin